MSGEEIKQAARNLQFDPTSHYAAIQKLIAENELDSPLSTEEVAHRVSETNGTKLPVIYVQTYMKKFMAAGLVHAVKIQGSRQNCWVLASVSKRDAIRIIGKARRVRDIEDELFSKQLVSKLGKAFRQELDELKDNFGRNGNCTAFLLRKILEKLIVIVFSKVGKEHVLEDPARNGRLKGLDEILQIAAREHHNGQPFLTPRTANEIRGIKFLGDAAAHNPLIGVDTTSILPQMPFIITAYGELAARL